jgi:hypothetical protein
MMHRRLEGVPYVISLTRAHTPKTDVWTLTIRDPLPTIRVPLRPPDDDVLLDLSAALRAVYDEAAYDRSIDYHAPPPPPGFAEADLQWMRECLGQANR